MLLLIALVFSTIFYFVEPRSNVESYPMAFWFSIVTMSTVGYGDIAPTTTLGYVIGFMLVVTSVFALATPVAIIGTSVARIWQDCDVELLKNSVRDLLHEFGYSAADIPILFEMFDPDGNGVLDRDEFRSMIESMGIGLTCTRVDALFNLFDADSNQSIDTREFLLGIYPQHYRQVAAKPRREQSKRNTLDEEPAWSRPAMSQGIVSRAASAETLGTRLSQVLPEPVELS